TSNAFTMNPTSTTVIYTLSLHDALPISGRARRQDALRSQATRSQPRLHVGSDGQHDAQSCLKRVPKRPAPVAAKPRLGSGAAEGDRKSTRLNSSHVKISYAVFCLKKKKP